MGRKHLGTALTCVLTSSFFLFSCVDKSYDLSKDVDLTIEVGGDAFMIPLGYTENITLDKMIDTTDVLRLDDDGLYSIKKQDNIDDVDVDVKEVNIKIDEPEFKGIIVNFEDKKVNDFTIDVPPSTTDLNAPEINVNVDLPTGKTMNTPKEVISGGLPSGQAFNAVVDVDDDTDFNFEYSKNSGWPEDVAVIESVFIGDKGNELGQKVTFRINTSDLNNAITIGEQKINIFTITFPDGIVLGKDNSSVGTVNENKFTLINHVLTKSEEQFSFYVVKQELNATREQGIDIKSSIKYHLEYGVSGTTKGSANGAGLTVKMDNADFKFRKADVITNDIEAKMSPGEFKIESTIDGLEDIRQVNYVTFKDSKIVLNFSDLGLPIGFQSGSVIVKFPDKFTLEKIADNKNNEITYGNNKLDIPAKYLSGAKITLALKKVTFDGKESIPVNDAIILNEPVTYYLKDNAPMILKGEVSTDKLAGLENKVMNITVDAGLMKVDNSNVVTDAVTADVEDKSIFNVDEDVDEALKVLKTVDWRSGVSPKINLKIAFPNFPSDIKELKFVNLKINLPKFLKFAPEDKVVNGVLTLNDQFIVANGYKKVLTVTGMNFSYMNNGVGLKTQVINGKTVLKIDTDNTVTIKGLVSTLGGETVNTDKLQNIKVQPTVSIDEMPVGKITGTVDPKIDPVNESISLDLGSDLDFLKEQGTNLDFTNPQISLVLSNTIGVPVDMDLNMKAMDANGKVVEGSTVVVNDKMQLAPAVVDGEPITTKFLLSRKKMAMPESTTDTIYKNIEIPDLANLMKVVPDKVDFKLTAKAAGSDHHIDLSKPMKITGNYDVVVPLEFQAIEINYKDTIDNLRDDLKDVSDKIVSAELKVLGDVSNAVPVDLHLAVNPLNAEGQLLNGISAKVMTYRVVNGESIPNKNEAGEFIISASVEDGKPTLTRISIELTSAGGDLKQLENLELVVHASATETVNGIALKKSQYVQLSKMYVKVKKVNLNLND